MAGNLQVTLEQADAASLRIQLPLWQVGLGRGDEGAPAGVSYKHDFELGGPKDRAPPKEDISDRFHVPEELIGEVLAAAANHRRQKSSKQLFVVDLFAGTVGAAGIVADSGIGYVPVDISTDLFPGQPPSAVIGWGCKLSSAQQE